MITKYLEDQIQVLDTVGTWEESIEVAAQQLLKKNYITPNYVKSMIENINTNGPYVVIMPEVAIPHSRPEEGAKKTTVSFLKINDAVSYPEGKMIKLIFVLAATDSDNHLELISSLTDLLMDAEKVERLKDAKTVEEIKEIVRSVEV
ncbi:PTS sugar transporter subunit IIA [Anaerotalea alkaliphila]|uniref:Ascorbate-specific PTS system EIIA component n=1 Tax=Anaerotalea alkaliphila TaxID=2662126 RepID=A0A7X5HXU8_9FIRM|nr:PTS sugar transporter subunit IIA [Anaerotalea alkaliphila]NDL68645.1 PTS sugar transporter subunit IIA [Anaerotalea alkaliphila]